MDDKNNIDINSITEEKNNLNKNKLIIIVSIGVILLIILLSITIGLFLMKKISTKNDNNLEDKQEEKIKLTDEEIEKINNIDLTNLSNYIVYDTPPGDFGSWTVSYNIPKEFKPDTNTILGSSESQAKFSFEDYLDISIEISRGDVGEYNDNLEFFIANPDDKYIINDKEFEVFKRFKNTYGNNLLEYNLELKPTDKNGKYVSYNEVPSAKKSSYYNIVFSSKYENALEIDKIKELIDVILNAKITEDMNYISTHKDGNWETELKTYHRDESVYGKYKIMSMNIKVPEKYNPIIPYSSRSTLQYEVPVNDKNYKIIYIYLSTSSNLLLEEYEIENTIQINDKEVQYGQTEDYFIAMIKINDNFYYQLAIENACNVYVNSNNQCNSKDKLSEEEIKKYLTELTNFTTSESFIIAE